MTTIKLPQINEDEEVNAEVTWEDQQNINSFSKLVSKYNDIEEQYEHKKVLSPKVLRYCSLLISLQSMIDGDHFA